MYRIKSIYSAATESVSSIQNGYGRKFHTSIRPSASNRTNYTNSVYLSSGLGGGCLIGPKNYSTVQTLITASQLQLNSVRKLSTTNYTQFHTTDQRCNSDVLESLSTSHQSQVSHTEINQIDSTQSNQTKQIDSTVPTQTDHVDQFPTYTHASQIPLNVEEEYDIRNHLGTKNHILYASNLVGKELLPGVKGNCVLCRNNLKFNYYDTLFLVQCIRENGSVRSKASLGICNKQYRHVKECVKKATALGLIDIHDRSPVKKSPTTASTTIVKNERPRFKKAAY